MSAGSIFENILNDAFLGLAAASSIFVKNANHQKEAGAAITALSALIAAIDAQLNPPATPPAS